MARTMNMKTKLRMTVVTVVVAVIGWFLLKGTIKAVLATLTVGGLSLVVAVVLMRLWLRKRERGG